MAMTGKTVLVTGANQGIGKETAKALAAMGAHVVLVCRNAEKGREATREISQAGGSAELLVADLATQAEVRRVAAEFRAKHATLDVLVNNAGVLVTERRITRDGIEETLAINHLASFLLTHELLEPLHAAAAAGREHGTSARIVNVASRAHVRAKPNLNDLQFSRGYSMTRVYGHSKLLNVLFTYELARRLAGANITANCLHPGVIASGFARTYGGLTAALARLVSPLLLTPEQGAKTSIFLASSPEVEGVTGRYFSDCRAVRSSSASYDVGAQAELWARSTRLVGLTADGGHGESSLWATIGKPSSTS